MALGFFLRFACGLAGAWACACLILSKCSRSLILELLGGGGDSEAGCPVGSGYSSAGVVALGAGSIKNSSGRVSASAGGGTNAGSAAAEAIAAAAFVFIRAGSDGLIGAGTGLIGAGAELSGSSRLFWAISSPGLSASGWEPISRLVLSSALSLAEAMRLAALDNLALPTSDFARCASMRRLHASEWACWSLPWIIARQPGHPSV